MTSFHALLRRSCLLQLLQGSGCNLRQLLLQHLEIWVRELRHCFIVRAHARGVFLRGVYLRATLLNHILQDVQALHHGLVLTSGGEGYRSFALGVCKDLVPAGHLLIILCNPLGVLCHTEIISVISDLRTLSLYM